MSQVLKVSEHGIQESFNSWIEIYQKRYSELANWFAIPNAGKRSYGALQYYLNEGLKVGVLDSFLAFPSCGYHGLFMEFKAGNNRLTQAQKDWFGKLSQAGYCCREIRSYEEATETVEEYLRKKIR